MSVPSPAQVTSLAFFFDDDGSRQASGAVALAAQQACPAGGRRGAIPGRAARPAAELGLHRGLPATPCCAIAAPASRLPTARLKACRWIGLSNQADPLLVAIHAVILPQEDAGAADTETLAQQWFASNDLVGASIGDGNAMALTDLRLHPDRNLGAGVTRLLVLDYGMAPRSAGACCKRLFELETYRMLALLALPVARRRCG